MEPVRISVVIPTYNCAHVLETTLEHLSRQEYPQDAYEVVVVDDGSTDGTPEVMARWADALRLRYLRQQNAGRAAARNRGAREARHEVLLFLDADVWAEANLLTAHAAHYRQGDRVAVQGPSRTHPRSKVNPFMEVKEMFPDLTPRRPHDLSPYHVITRNFSVRAEDFWRVGGFDEAFSGYGWEDIELGVRLRRSGVRIHWEPGAITWHYHVEDLESARRKLVEAGRGAVYFWNKNRRPLGLGLFLELHPILLPLKWLVYRSGVFTPWIRKVLEHTERRLLSATGASRKLWLAVANECYAHLLWGAYYEGVWQALREGLYPGVPVGRCAS
ncbi:MAG: glycosyltransferase [Armatimonadota bacterium]|nr:glycosyltransferase [Armatimonadota bacterium]MDR7438394.1 glycosyltransferase [Armatimonadota bacterium]MDR7563872.1 glycosyltransferase [Armatimonadota bacterium]MDR7601238.1 glycosyltransferase [Armatimonadota bacterium]